MEHTPGSPDGTHTFLNTINSDAFQEALRDAHNWLRHPDERTANDIKSLIGDELPTSYCDLPLRVVGLMYDADAVLSRAQNKNVSFPSVDTTPKHPMGLYNAQLWGIQIVTLEEEAQIVLDIRLNTDDENDPSTRRQTRFFLIPDSDNIADIEFGEASYAEFTPEPSLEPTDTITENPELTDTIAGLADSSRDVIESPEFSSMSAADRRAILETIERNATQALLKYLDADEDIACVTNNFYIIPDGASMKHIERYRVDLTQPGQDSDVIEGDNWKVFYPETAIYPSRDFTTPEDFFIGHRSPCLSLRDEGMGCSYWIPLHSIARLGWPAEEQ